MRPAKAEDSAGLERDGLRDGLRVVRVVGGLRPNGKRERMPTVERVLGLLGEVVATVLAPAFESVE
jgi:hypothetical protein